MKRITLVVAAVVFALAAGTFGTLLLLERSDHRKAAEELTALRTETDGVKAELAEAEKTRNGWNDRILDTAEARRTAETAALHSKWCVEAAREWLNAQAGNSAALDKKLDDVLTFCSED